MTTATVVAHSKHTDKLEVITLEVKTSHDYFETLTSVMPRVLVKRDTSNGHKALITLTRAEWNYICTRHSDKESFSELKDAIDSAIEASRPAENSGIHMPFIQRDTLFSSKGAKDITLYTARLLCAVYIVETAHASSPKLVEQEKHLTAEEDKGIPLHFINMSEILESLGASTQE